MIASSPSILVPFTFTFQFPPLSLTLHLISHLSFLSHFSPGLFTSADSLFSLTTQLCAVFFITTAFHPPFSTPQSHRKIIFLEIISPVSSSSKLLSQSLDFDKS
ncbi:hypothetical protein P152DRAFT_171730 [Eremomyces bilateralis CBS 781.70]|uniref:Uncharacterized protein n=1 Tax=Eremomyces bilateralis CBS 781.70 TaxID=1392243 RepID=A0A6G1FTX9_9PEZI|nr:uncharacterized protein P152DRAFT_171730 [Eremomyces bilateralis CBS 781.70]KAF1809166.1 hypothetical protein P152DRAFT_171730 [Eremomyces bilateralis CBS 781.70]